MTKEVKIKNLKTIFFLLFLLSTINYRLSAIFAQEPIILPPVTITGEDKSENIIERFQRQPGVIMGELPKVQPWGQRTGGSFFSLLFSAGGYDYINWKITGGKEKVEGSSGQVFTYLALIDKLKVGPYGSAGRLSEYNVDKFNLDFSSPFFWNTGLFSSINYQERNEFLTHTSISSIMGGTGDVINHRVKDAELSLGWKGKIGNLVHLTLSPYYSYAGIIDERINVDALVLNQEIGAGLKLNAQADMKNLSLVGDLQAEGSQRPALNKSGTNITVYFAGKSGIPKIPNLGLELGLQYINSYLFSIQHHFNPEIRLSYRFRNGLLLRTGFKGETVFPAYKLFTGNYLRFNPLLKEEQDWNFSLCAEKEFGKDTDKLRGNGSLKFFHKNQENLILPGSKNVLWQLSNLPGAIQFGIGLSTKIYYSIWKGSIYGRADYTLRQIIPGEGKSVPYLPGNELQTGIGYKVGPFKIEISADYHGFCYSDTQSTSVIPGYFLTNLNISSGITKEIFIFFEGKNLFDVQYQVLDDYPTKGRSFKGGIVIGVRP